MQLNRNTSFSNQENCLQKMNIVLSLFARDEDGEKLVVRFKKIPTEEKHQSRLKFMKESDSELKNYFNLIRMLKLLMNTNGSKYYSSELVCIIFNC